METQLEYLEGEESNAGMWDYKIKDKLFLSTSREVLSALEKVEDKGTIVQVDPRELKLSGLNPRQLTFETKGTGQLERDIIRTGRIKDPLIVRINPFGVPEIIDGGLRWRLAIIHGIPTVPVLVEKLSDDEAILRIESSNKKVKHDPITRGVWLLQLSRKYGSNREVARKLGINESTVRDYTALNALPDVSREAVRKGKMSWLIALDILEELKELYGKVPEDAVAYYTKKYLELKKQSEDKVPLTRQKFREWMRAMRQQIMQMRGYITEEDYGYRRKTTTFGTFKPFKPKVEKEIENIDRKLLQAWTTKPRKMSTWHCPNCGKNYGITCDGKKCTLYEEK